MKGPETLATLQHYATDAWLLDAHVPGQFGGTGETFNWQLATEAAQLGRPIFLAGGLTPANVDEAIRAVPPYGVDVREEWRPHQDGRITPRSAPSSRRQSTPRNPAAELPSGERTRGLPSLGSCADWQTSRRQSCHHSQTLSHMRQSLRTDQCVRVTKTKLLPAPGPNSAGEWGRRIVLRHRAGVADDGRDGCRAGFFRLRRILNVLVEDAEVAEGAWQLARYAREFGHFVMSQTATADLPDAQGHFGPYGGCYVPETLMHPLQELRDEYHRARTDRAFQSELDYYLREFCGRPTPLYFAERLTRELGGAKIYLKREDLLHTGAHKINNCIGQILLARRMGKTRIIAETGAGQHGVATATVAAMFGMECVIYMGAVDCERQALNVYRMKMLGAEVVPVNAGQTDAQGGRQRSDARLGHQRSRTRITSSARPTARIRTR